MASLYIFNLSEQLEAVIDPNDAEAPFTEALHLEQINGENSFKFQIPANHPKADFIQEGKSVAFKDLDGDFQLFEIKVIEEVHANTLTKSVFCEHSAFEMLDDLVLFSWQRDQDATTILDAILQNSRWETGDVTVSGTATVRIELNNPIEGINKMIEAFDEGEVKYRIEISGNSISGRFVDFLDRRGSDTGRRFEYKKDITSIEREVDITNLKTALYGFGKAQEVPGGTTRLRFTDIEWSTADGDPADKPAGQQYIEDSDALDNFGREGGTRNRFGFFEDPEETNPVRLLINTYRKLQEVKDPRVSYDMKVFDFAEITGLDAKKVRLGDDIIAIDNEFNPSLKVSVRVIEFRRNLITNENDELILGNFIRLNTEDGIQLRNITTRVNSKEGVWEDAAYNNNMVNDGSFDAVPTTGSVINNNQEFSVDTDTHDAGNFFWWQWDGSDPRIISTVGTGAPRFSLYNFQAALIKTESNPYQYLQLDTELGINGPYTFSFYASAHPGTTTDGTATLEVYAVDGDGNDIEKMDQAEIKIRAGEDYKWKRGQVTVFDFPSNTELIRISVYRDSDTPDLEYIADGIQGVPKDTPSIFLSNKELYRFYNGLAGATPKNFQVRNYAQIGWNPDIGSFNFEFQENGLFRTTNNSQFSTTHQPAQTLTAGEWTKINFEGSVFVDHQNEFDNTNSEFVPNEAGVYIFQVGLRIENINSGSQVALRITRDGNEDTRIWLMDQASGSGIATIRGNVLIFAPAGAVYAIEAYCGNAADTIQDSQQSTWKAFRIGGRR